MVQHILGALDPLCLYSAHNFGLWLFLSSYLSFALAGLLPLLGAALSPLERLAARFEVGPLPFIHYRSRVCFEEALRALISARHTHATLGVMDEDLPSHHRPYAHEAPTSQNSPEPI